MADENLIPMSDEVRDAMIRACDKAQTRQVPSSMTIGEFLSQLLDDVADDLSDDKE